MRDREETREVGDDGSDRLSTTPPSSPSPPMHAAFSSRQTDPVSPLTPMERSNDFYTAAIDTANGVGTAVPSIVEEGAESDAMDSTAVGSQRTGTLLIHAYTDRPRSQSSRDQTACTSPGEVVAAVHTAVHETVHAQSLLLGLAFMSVWSANNLMAPNLTEMAEFFDMDDRQRDLYLGSYCALAVGVFSLPISALIGILTDFMSRKYLFVATVLGGCAASTATGLSKDFTSLLFARLVNGGCMSGSVPIAFSLLGDLFVAEDRNSASSGLTAMMGLGIVLGQVYAGIVGSSEGWSHAFFVSSVASAVSAGLVLLFVREPVRGGKEKVLQDLIRSGTKYDRRLTWDGFTHSMKHNASNRLLIWQGFFSSVPWGIIFVFLNDFLSQEKGFSVPDATFMVMLFGIGCAIGGIIGGYLGQTFMRMNRSYLPLFMAVSTLVGYLPFCGLLNASFPNPRGYLAMFFATSGGIIASLPSVNVRPCILNVNPPESRGATLTAANLIIMVARGVGPSCITLMGGLFHVSRQFSFNFTLIAFWLVSSIQLVMLSRTLPNDQDIMETELARYAEEAIQLAKERRMTETALQRTKQSSESTDDNQSLVSIEDRMISFDGLAAQESIRFMRMGIKEISEEMIHFGHFDHCGEVHSPNSQIADGNGDTIAAAGRPTTVTRQPHANWFQRSRVAGRDRGPSDAIRVPTERTALLTTEDDIDTDRVQERGVESAQSARDTH